MRHNSLNEIDYRFHQLIADAIALYTTNQVPDPEAEYSLRTELNNVFMSGQVSMKGIIQAFFDFLSRPQPTKVKLTCIILLDDLILNNKLQGRPSYSEIFWLVEESNILFEVADISDITRIIGLSIKLVGSDLIRSKLRYILAKGEKSQYKSAILAFYLTKHDLASIKVLDAILEELDEGLQTYAMENVITFIESNQSIFSRENVVFLKSFISKGLNIDNLKIIEKCNRTLQILNHRFIS